MQLVQPTPFPEAVNKIGGKSLIGSKLKSSEWADVPVALRDRAFFSSQVESLRFLQRARDTIADWQQMSREEVAPGVTALKTGSRAQFVDLMQSFLAREGIERTTGGLTDIAGERRLGLIFDTNTRAANDYGYWRQGQDADVLDEFPAQRFIRVLEVHEPRDYHAPYEDQVFLKTDPIWSRVINRDFNVPWGPWGWGCGHDVEDVDRDEAERLGLIQPGQRIAPDEKHFNENLQASTKGLDPDLLTKLVDAFRDQLVIEGDTIKWQQRPLTETATTPPPAVVPPLPTTTATSLNPKVAAALEEHEAKLLRRRASEKIVALDASGNAVLAKAGEKSSVGITAPELAKLKDTVLTHNHPFGVSFSWHDISTTRKADLAELRAVGVRLKYRYVLRRPPGGWPPGMEAKYREIESRIVRTELALYRAGQMTSAELEKAGHTVAHRVMEEMARELNVFYERTQRA